MVPVAQSRLAARRLIELGITCQYREEHGYGHASKLIGDSMPRVIEWFERQRLARCPEHVTLAVPPGESLRAYWIEMPKNDYGAACATVDARLETDGHLVIRTSFLSELTVILERLPGQRDDSLKLTINGQSFDLDSRAGVARLKAAGSPHEWSCAHDATTAAAEQE